MPASTAIFDSVVITVTANGIENKGLRTDEEWEAVGNSAAAMIESGNLLLLGSRAVDKDEWVKMSQAMIESGKARVAGDARTRASRSTGRGDRLNESCDACHGKYQRGA